MTAKVPYAWRNRQPWLELDLPIAEFEARITAVQDRLRQAGLDALLVWEHADRGSNVRYLTGFNMVWGTSIALVHRDREPVLLTNAVAHGEPMHSNIQTAWLRDVRISFEGTSAALMDMALRLLADWGTESDGLAVAGHGDIPFGAASKLVESYSVGALEGGDPILRRQRAIKTPAEIAIIRQVADLTSRAMAAAVAAARVGASESDVAAEAHRVCMAGGAERMSFGCFPAAGRRGALKNVFPGPDRKIGATDLVVIDLGCKLKGYQSDMSRNAIAEPSASIASILAATQAANDAAFALVRPGVTTDEVLAVMRDTVAQRGYADWEFCLCHGFGMDLTETPMFLRMPPSVLEAGMCFYVEPIIADESFGCACIEDMLLVTNQGCEKLTAT
jgi:Xaa-Pro aminopeptidase